MTDHGEGGQAGYFDAIAVVGSAGLYFAQEKDLVLRFFDRHMQIADAVECLGEFG